MEDIAQVVNPDLVRNLAYSQIVAVGPGAIMAAVVRRVDLSCMRLKQDVR